MPKPVQIQHAISEQFKCGVCLDVAKDPVPLKCADEIAHFLCKSCCVYNTKNNKYVGVVAYMS